MKVEKRKYFCIVEQLKSCFRTIIIGVILLTVSGNQPIMAQERTGVMDSVEVSLLTCSPHEEIYSLYGHTALRYHNLCTNEDWVFNYGIFNFKKPFFILRFALGITDYELGVVPFTIFQREYSKFGSQVTEQILNITYEEKQAIYNALNTNYLPENRVYRYNFFYDNCTTRARDMIEKCINGKIQYAEKKNYTPTYREIIHEKTSQHPWAAFGNDLCLGFKADLKTSQREQQFLPENLMYDFDKAQIYSEGEYKPLVKEKNFVVMPRVQIIEKDFPLSPRECAYIILILSIIIISIEYKKKYIFKAWDILLMLAEGISGIIILILFFSEHPTTSTNAQVLLLNPIPLFFIPQVINGKNNTYWVYSIITITLFFIGAFFQDYAEGMEIVALSLLTRCWIHLKPSIYPITK